MSRAIIAAIINGVRPVDLAAPGLVRRVVRESLPPDAEAVLAMGPEIEAALSQAEEVAQHSYRMVQKCLLLKPTPSPKTPPGF